MHVKNVSFSDCSLSCSLIQFFNCSLMIFLKTMFEMNSLLLFVGWNYFSCNFNYCWEWIFWQHKTVFGINYLIVLSTIWKEFLDGINSYME